MNNFQQQRDDAELVGCKLAYEAGVHWLDANVRALEALRTRSLALMSVMLLAATFVAGFAKDAITGTETTKGETLGVLGSAGLLLFALSMMATIVLGVYVVWTARFTAELGPGKIIKKHVDPILTWPSARVYKAIATDLDGDAKKSRSLLRKRANCYKWSLLGVPAGVVGLALLWLDATL